MKINNKGMTLVELIITFALLMAMIIGLYNLILSAKFQMEEREVAKDVNAYASTTSNHIHYSLLKSEPKYLFLKSSVNSTWESLTTGKTYEKEGDTITLENGSLNYSTTSFNNNYCHQIYPCLIYVNSHNNDIGVVALFNREVPLAQLPTFLQGRDYGILYGVKSGSNSSIIFDPLPDSNELQALNFSIDSNSKELTYISYDESENIVDINYPLYILDNPKNYGFKISYPLLY